ncbi:Aste57867_608 [Aphanomyces stellatus]|uniref:Aste57867_608 protein n=1 Tax=Aphanomyces stellatus TaxID=120398 RepID=A0A485K822_9STRA|nr:hypothetical protein As57867_000607 [Aphanomyces stellatus]VFT77833.1 Aste57867_608 [Aphanomyces stellatus]
MARIINAVFALTTTAVAASVVYSQTPQHVILDNLAVWFSSRPLETFRLQIAVSEDNKLPLRMWLESKQSKAQWTCLVTDFQNHAPNEAKYVLPLNAIVAGMEHAIAPQEKLDIDESAHVDLIGLQNNHLRLQLRLHAFSTLSAQYEFDMKPTVVEPIDVLEAKVRDLEIELPAAIKQVETKLRAVEAAVAAKPSVYFSYSTDIKRSEEMHITWDTEHDMNTAYFQLSPGKTVISLKEPGIYQIYVNCKFQNGNGGQTVNLWIHDSKAWSAPVSALPGYNFAEFSYTAVVTMENTEAIVYYTLLHSRNSK